MQSGVTYATFWSKICVRKLRIFRIYKNGIREGGMAQCPLRTPLEVMHSSPENNITLWTAKLGIVYSNLIDTEASQSQTALPDL